MSSFAEKPILHFTSPEEWEAFLENDPPQDGVRLKARKAKATEPGISRSVGSHSRKPV